MNLLIVKVYKAFNKKVKIQVELLNHLAQELLI